MGMKAGGGRHGRAERQGVEGAGGNQDWGRDASCADHSIVVSGGFKVEEVCLLDLGMAAAEVDGTHLHMMMRHEWHQICLGGREEEPPQRTLEGMPG